MIVLHSHEIKVKGQATRWQTAIPIGHQDVAFPVPLQPPAHPVVSLYRENGEGIEAQVSYDAQEEMVRLRFSKPLAFDVLAVVL